MCILFTICGRAGSKGVANKNSRRFLGYPIALFTVSVIELYLRKYPQQSCDIVLNTDSVDLMNDFDRYVETKYDIIHRNAELGMDITPKIEVIKNCMEIMEKRTSKHYNIIVDLDITSPLRTVRDLENLILKMRHGNADVIFSVTGARRNPYFNMVERCEFGFKRVIDSNYNARQEAPEVFDMNASMYAYSPSFLRKKMGLFEGKVDVIMMRDTAVLDIDTEEDFVLMEVMAKHFFSEIDEYRSVAENVRDNCGKSNDIHCEF